MAWKSYKKKTESKYKSKKVEYEGIKFDSKKEKQRFIQLNLMQRAGEITDLQRQVKFVLIPAQREPDTVGKRGGVKKGKIIEYECSYIADFTYYDKDDNFHVEDVKGYKEGAAYNLFKIKRKLMLKEHGIRVEEI